jgi:hypothetical protein
MDGQVPALRLLHARHDSQAPLVAAVARRAPPRLQVLQAGQVRGGAHHPDSAHVGPQGRAQLGALLLDRAPRGDHQLVRSAAGIHHRRIQQQRVALRAARPLGQDDGTFTAVATSTPRSRLPLTSPRPSSGLGISPRHSELIKVVGQPFLGEVAALLGDADRQLVTDVVVAVGDEQRLVETAHGRSLGVAGGHAGYPAALEPRRASADGGAPRRGSLAPPLAKRQRSPSLRRGQAPPEQAACGKHYSPVGLSHEEARHPLKLAQVLCQHRVSMGESRRRDQQIEGADRLADSRKLRPHPRVDAGSGKIER